MFRCGHWVCRHPHLKIFSLWGQLASQAGQPASWTASKLASQPDRQPARGAERQPEKQPAILDPSASKPKFVKFFIQEFKKPKTCRCQIGGFIGLAEFSL